MRTTNATINPTVKIIMPITKDMNHGGPHDLYNAWQNM